MTRAPPAGSRIGPASPATGAAAIDSAVYFDGANWDVTGGANSAFVPPDFQYSVLPVPSPRPYVIDYNLNAAALRNNLTGWVGFELTVGATPMTVSSLRRLCVAGNTGTHTVELVNASTSTVVGSVSLNTATACTGIAGQFAYANLGTSITLQANTTYYLASQETSGGDQWFDLGTLTTTSAAAAANGAFSSKGSSFTNIGSANNGYVPVNLLYQ